MITVARSRRSLSASAASGETGRGLTAGTLAVDPALRPYRGARFGEAGRQLSARYPLHVQALVGEQVPDPDRGVPPAVGELCVDLDAMAAVVGLGQHAERRVRLRGIATRHDGVPIR